MRSTVPALKNGTISALAAQPAIEEGTTQVDAVVNYLRAQPGCGRLRVLSHLQQLIRTPWAGARPAQGR
jgi:hypothetical protein